MDFAIEIIYQGRRQIQSILIVLFKFPQLESLIFPTSWSRRWQFIANVTNDPYGVKEMYLGLQAVLDESEKADPGIFCEFK